jgi:hypothetical protein
MKTYTMYSLGLAATFLVNGVARAEVSLNILAHSGFESYDYDDAWRGSNVARWSTFETTGIGGIVIKPYGGSYMVGKADNTTHVELYQSGNITDYLGTGGTRIYAGVVTTSNKKTGTECQLDVTYYDAANKIISQDTTGKVACATSAGVWQELKFMNTIPANTVAVGYSLEGFTADYSGYTLFDSAYLLIEPCNGDCPPYSPLWGFKTIDQIIADTRAKCQENPAECGIQPGFTQADLDAARDSAAAVISENLDIQIPLGYLLKDGGKVPLSADFQFIPADESFTWQLKTYQFK